MFAAKIDDLGSLRGNAVQALARWWHSVASSKAWDMLHWAMCPTLYRHIRMAIEIASNLPEFVVVADFIVGLNRS